MFTFRGRVRDTDGHSRSEGSEKTERIGVFELTGLGADAATISAKRHRIEQIVLNGLTVYSFEGTTKKGLWHIIVCGSSFSVGDMFSQRLIFSF